MEASNCSVADGHQFSHCYRLIEQQQRVSVRVLPHSPAQGSLQLPAVLLSSLPALSTCQCSQGCWEGGWSSCSCSHERHFRARGQTRHCAPAEGSTCR